MRKRAFSTIEVIASMLLVSSAFALSYQLMGFVQKKSQKSREIAETSLERIKLQIALNETLGLADHIDTSTDLLSESQGVLSIRARPFDSGLAFVFENFADIDPDLCGRVYGKIMLNKIRHSIELELFPKDEEKLKEHPGKVTQLMQGVEDWEIEMLDLRKSRQWEKKKCVVVREIPQAFRLQIKSKGKWFSVVINCQNDSHLDLRRQG